MSVFVSDTFTDTDAVTLASHTGETGATWTKHTSSGTGAAEILSNRLTDTGSSSTAEYYASGTPGTSEYDVEADLYRDSVSGVDASIMGRVDTSAATWYLAQYHSTSGQWRLYKRVSGSWTQLGTYSHVIASGATHAFKLEIRDAAKKVFVDSVERISSADNAITAAGKAGIRFDCGTNVDGRLDNLVATDLVAAGGANPKNVFGLALEGPLTRVAL